MSKELPSCSGCEHEYECVNLVCFYELLEREKQKIRADAIEETCKQISERVEYWDSCAKAMEKGSNEYKIFISLAKNFDELAEQLKEQKNEH